jgi:predicted site-specific integrase-resolvase
MSSKLLAPVHQRAPIEFYLLREWCQMRGISKATARRLHLAGKLKLTRLSERRVGVRSDHDREYLDACLEA